MMTIKFIILILITTSILFSCNKPKKVDVTYIANDGFLLESGGRQVLIDALYTHVHKEYEAPHDSIITKIVERKKPFEKVEIIFITHADKDHFNDSMVVQYLNRNPNNKLIAPTLVVDAILKHPDYNRSKNQIIEISKETQYEKDTIINGIRIQTFFCNHSYNPNNKPNIMGKENVGYLIDLEGVKLLHTGDWFEQDTLEIEKLKLYDKNIDIAFLGTFWLNDRERKLAINYIASKNIIFMHCMPLYHEEIKKAVVEINKTVDNIELTLFDKSMEKKSFTFD